MVRNEGKEHLKLHGRRNYGNWPYTKLLGNIYYLGEVIPVLGSLCYHYCFMPDGNQHVLYVAQARISKDNNWLLHGKNWGHKIQRGNKDSQLCNGGSQ